MEKWKQFEERVGDIFRLKGYKVVSDSLIQGRQTDLFLSTPLEPIGPILVECKYHFRSRKVGVEEVEAFAARVIRLRASGLISSGYLVTNTGFTTGALGQLSETERRFIFLRTLDEIRSSLIIFRPYLESLVHEYEAEEHHTIYEPLHARAIGRRKPIKLCDELLTNFIEDSPERILVLTADYGMGKTTSLRHLAYIMAKRELDNAGSTRIPVFIPLKWYAQAGGAVGLLQRFLNVSGLSHANVDALLAMHASGHLCLLLDGFDEMARRTTPHTRVESLADLIELDGGASKIILSGRPGYFPHPSELQDALAATEVSDTRDRIRVAMQSLSSGKPPLRRRVYAQYSLDFLDRQQIESFLARRCGDGAASRIVEKIKTTYNLRDLAKRPILLEMIGETFREEQARQIVSPADMYNAYTGAWLDIDHSKGYFRQLLTSRDRLAFSIGLAATFQRESIHQIHWTDLQRIVQDYFRLEEPDDVDHFSGDIRTCTFLHRDDDGYYEFAHQSFQEYFLARFIVSDEQELWHTFGVGYWIEAPFANLPDAVVNFASDIARVPLHTRYWERVQDALAFASRKLLWENDQAEDMVVASVVDLVDEWRSVEDTREFVSKYRATLELLRSTCSKSIKEYPDSKAFRKLEALLFPK